MIPNEKIIAEAECKPKLSIGAVCFWVIAAVILAPGIYGAIEANETFILIFMAVIASLPALAGVALQASMMRSGKTNAIIATERCIYCKSNSTKHFSYGDGMMEIPYESIINIRVSPESPSSLNGDMVVLYLPGSSVNFRYITNAPQIVMAIKSKVEEKKGPMPPYGYGMPVMPPMGAYSPYQQPMYGQSVQGYGQPMQRGYGQPMYGQPMPNGYAQPYGQPNYGPVAPMMAPPPQSPYQPVRPEYQYPSQTVYPNVPPAPAKTETARPAKYEEGLQDTERPLFDAETGERIVYDDEPVEEAKDAVVSLKKEEDGEQA
ncbi:hypothetical protein [Ruminococcus sp.]|uniref:hypothetical protein n=1 Tax=Ruminococcus sp. TaxID=41978 RepID=UPI0025FA5CEF|nr:hypothetical protein [Ruminococcus sp.]MBQ8965079.1 hypothetical protein [Ruminococcus sp.]